MIRELAHSAARYFGFGPESREDAMTFGDAARALITVVLGLLLVDAASHALGTHGLAAMLLLALLIGAAFGGFMRTVQRLQTRGRHPDDG